MPECTGLPDCSCWGCIQARADIARATVRTKLAMERRYPMAVNGIVRPVPYSLARKNTRYSERCVSESHPEDNRPATARGSWLCPGCEERIRDGLRDIAEAWPLLEEMTHRGQGAKEERAGGASIHSPAPLELGVVDVMAETSDWLWAQAAHWHGDHPAMVLRRDQTVPALANWLRRWHSGYFGSHPDSSYPAAVAGEVGRVASRIRRLVNPRERRIDLGARCGQYTFDVQGTGARCPGELYGIVAEAGGTAAEIRCSHDGTHVIQQHNWLMLNAAEARKDHAR